MRFNIDEYAYRSSAIHRWEPHYKFLSVLSLIFAFASIQSLLLIPPILIITIVFFVLSKLPIRFLYDRLHYPGYFILGMVGLLPWISGETILWQWQFLTLRQEGLMSMALITGRFFSIVTLSLILFSTTPFLVTVKTLRSLGMPALLVDMLLLTYRYLFELAATLQTMQRSMQLRGFSLSRNSPHLFDRGWRNSKQWAALIGTLLIRSYEQSDRIVQAMRLRGYGRSQLKVRRFWQDPLHFASDIKDLIAFFIVTSLALLLIVLNIWVSYSVT
ncbi:MAG: cobalt ECF transporter T component CbiQ [Prochlorotrichaceae cyanobacterium]|jgi:cobalt/nickel transport system permease protein